MIGEILRYINKYFVDTAESSTAYNIVADGIEGDFSETYVTGQYISVDGSKINDGVYKLTEAVQGKLTVSETLLPESTNNEVCIFGLNVPRDLISLSEEIAANGSADGIASESQGGRSVSYSNGGSWQEVYSARLMKYKSIYNDKENRIRNYNITTKR